MRAGRTRHGLWAGAILVALASACARPSGPDAAGGGAHGTHASVRADGRGFRVQHAWPVLPEGRLLGQVSAVDVDSHGHVFVLHRARRAWSEPFPESRIPDATVAVFDAGSGQQVAGWGADRFVMPHGLTIDHRDQVWITDVGLQQVFHFDHDGQLLMRLGEAGVAGDDDRHFGRPTAVAVLWDGSFYVSDGYLNSRVLRFSPDGKLAFQWGEPGDGPGQFDVPHDVDVDALGRVYVSDRGNARVQVFDPRGRYLFEWKDEALGRPYALALAPDGHAFWLDGGDLPKSYARPDRSRVLRLDPVGAVVGSFGRFGNQDGQFVLPHDLAVGTDGAVYVADVYGRRIQKFIRSP